MPPPWRRRVRRIPQVGSIRLTGITPVLYFGFRDVSNLDMTPLTGSLTLTIEVPGPTPPTLTITPGTGRLITGVQDGVGPTPPPTLTIMPETGVLLTGYQNGIEPTPPTKTITPLTAAIVLGS